MFVFCLFISSTGAIPYAYETIILGRLWATVKINSRERRLFIYYSIVPLSASLHFKLNALLFRRMRVVSRLAADSRGSILPRDLSRCTVHFFLFFYVGVHVLCIRCPGNTDACVPDLLPATRRPTLPPFFFPFPPSSPLNPWFSCASLSSRWNLRMSCGVVQLGMWFAGAISYFSNACVFSRFLSHGCTDHSYDCQERFITFENYFEVTHY